jgi:hypothetical protein
MWIIIIIIIIIIIMFWNKLLKVSYSFVVYDIVAVTDPFSYTVQTSDPVVKLNNLFNACYIRFCYLLTYRTIYNIGSVLVSVFCILVPLIVYISC